MSETFDERYELGILDELPADETARRDIAPRAASEPFALHGCVLTPDRKIDDGYVLVTGADIESVGDSKPGGGAKIVETDGVILPGLIDLHGHPEYNVFAAWEPPKLYKNRYAWRSSDEYDKVVRKPWATLTGDPSLLTMLTRYAEIRALVGGATAIQGASAKYPGKDEALVRNVDLRIFGDHKARSVIDLSRATPDDRKRLRDHIDAGEVTAVYIHLAEGLPGDARSEKEFQDLVGGNLLTAATVIIHGTALTDANLGDVKDAGAKLVWSPQSNLRLYGDTTHAAKAIDLGVPLGLGADWLPSGSQSLLGELKVARRRLLQQGASPGRLAKTLVHAVTAGGAAVAGLDGKLGTLDAGRPADVLVLERRNDDPWENVVEADPSWVELVTIGGDVAYGRADWVQDLTGAGAELEDVIAWGKAMKLDTSYAAAPTGATPVRLAEIRKALLGRFPQTGPIFA